MAPTIDKRTFLAASGCHTAGWYAHREERTAPTDGLEWRFYVGGEIGRLARRQLGTGKMLPIAPTATGLEATARALADPDARLLFEATFAAGEFVARADAVRRVDGGWDILEVKSALAPEDGVPDDEHLDDLAYTVFVAAAAGIAVVRCTLLLLSRETRLGAESLTELDVTDEVTQRATLFAARAPAIAAACLASDRPEPALKFICRKCDFFASDCIGKNIPDPLFVLPRLSAKRFEALRPYERLSAVPAGADLTDPQRRVFAAVRSGQPLIDRAALAPLKQVVWPVFYLDFEAVTPALPWFAECPPYETIPFQFSIHVCDRPGHETAHSEYLAPIGADWREELAVALIDALGSTGSIVVYSSYEKQRLSAMAKALPQFEAQLAAIINRLVDFEPLVRHGYCHPGFGGRTSIKNVLPVVAPELSYAGMVVGNGDDAAGLFALMTVGKRDALLHPTHRRQLLEYCKLDTLAMVKLHEALDALLYS